MTIFFRCNSANDIGLRFLKLKLKNVVNLTVLLERNLAHYLPAMLKMNDSSLMS